MGETPAAPRRSGGGEPSRIGPHGEGLVVLTEQLAEFGGVERITEVVMAIYPAATVVVPRFAPVAGFPGGDFHGRVRARPAFERHGFEPRIRWIERTGPRRHYLTPLYARWVRGTPIGEARAVLSLGGMGWTLAARVPPGARHVGYVGGRPRPFWGKSTQYLSEYPRGTRVAIRAALPAMRRQYRRMIERPHVLASNSRFSATSLESLTRRSPAVVYPPVNCGYFTSAPRERSQYLVVARLRAHKRVELVIEAFRRLGEPLVVAGDGPLRDEFVRAAPPNVSFAGHLQDAELRELYRSSHAVVSASVEQFGLCLAEAQAAGTPVIAPRAGGSGEIVEHGRTGLLLDTVDSAAIVDAVRRLAQIDIDPADCRRNAERFSEQRFADELEDLLEGEL